MDVSYAQACVKCIDPAHNNEEVKQGNNWDEQWNKQMMMVLKPVQVLDNDDD